MPYIAQHWYDNDVTGLPGYHVFDAEEYNDPTIRNLRPVGEVWITGTPAATGYMPTGWRWQLSGTGMTGASEEMPLTSYPAAVRDGVKAIANAIDTMVRTG